jgi:hypothetical protein
MEDKNFLNILNPLKLNKYDKNNINYILLKIGYDYKTIKHMLENDIIGIKKTCRKGKLSIKELVLIDKFITCYQQSNNINDDDDDDKSKRNLNMKIKSVNIFFKFIQCSLKLTLIMLILYYPRNKCI